ARVRTASRPRMTSHDIFTSRVRPCPVATMELRVGAWVFEALVDGPTDGELVLLLHGFPESAAEWHAVMPQLADAGCYAVAPNQRGYSPAARPVGVHSYHLTHLVDDALGIAMELGSRGFVLVGHEWGALGAGAVAAWHGDRVPTLAIVSVPHPRPFAAARASDPDQQERSRYRDVPRGRRARASLSRQRRR